MKQSREQKELETKTKFDFLNYANAVIHARAIPSVEDNLKPIHRRILYTMYMEKLTSNAKPKKSMATVGDTLKLSPHGDASVYDALVRLAQWWKLRYPLVEMQGNSGNLLGDGPAAARYTNAHLSVIGDLMLEDIDKDCVKFVPNYDESIQEPVTLPSRFPYLLCGNNNGIAVGLSSYLVSFNFTEVKSAIEIYLSNPNATIEELTKPIIGPDFPTGGLIVNGEDLLGIYKTGHGSIKLRAHYDIETKGKKTNIIFHDLPYGVEIESGVIAPLKKLVLEEGNKLFDDVQVNKSRDGRNFDITVILMPNADINAALDTLFKKTRLQSSITVNQMVLVDGQPQLLNFKQLIEHWVNYRSGVIQRIAQNQYDKLNHKYTIVIGLRKCLSDITKLITLIRNADSREDAKVKIKAAFELNDEQADAVLDMKLSRLNRLDAKDLDNQKSKLETEMATSKNIIDNQAARFNVIRDDLAQIKTMLGEDKRLTEVQHHLTLEEKQAVLIKREYKIYSGGLKGNPYETDLVAVLSAYEPQDIITYCADGSYQRANEVPNSSIIGAFVFNQKKTKVIGITKSGHIKVSAASDYNFDKGGKIMRIKDGDAMIFAALVDDKSEVVVFSRKVNRIVKLAINDLPTASKMTIGTKLGLGEVDAAVAVVEEDEIYMINNSNQGKRVLVRDFKLDKRTNKGQIIADETAFIGLSSGRQNIYIVPQKGKLMNVAVSKMSIKGKTANGINLTERNIERVI